MKKLIVIMINVHLILLIMTVQGAINMDSKVHQEMYDSLSTTMSQVMYSVKNNNGISLPNQNELVALLLQGMISRLDSAVDLTVIIHECNMQKGELDIEAVGEYEFPTNRKRKVAVRRKMIMNE
ncbi:MAG: hypothetical protein J5972_00990 [Eubacterium sp.]|nr:hypothetical protein [Eubacterium sp.]